MSRVHVVLDGNNILAINAHAFPRLAAEDGFPTGAMFGAIKMLRVILLQEIQEDVASVWCVMDAGRPSFRKKLCPTYKTKREKAKAAKDDEQFYANYRLQLQTVHRLMTPLGVNVVSAPGFEADDLIAGLVLHGDCKPSVVVSGDKDLIQLVGPKVRVFRPSSDFVEKRPLGYLLNRCMTGDSSDDIPGAGGLGDTRASAIVEWLDSTGNKMTPKGLRAAVSEAKDFPHRNFLCGKDGGLMEEKLQRIARNWTVMNLRYTAADAYAAMQVQPGKFSERRFRKRCKRYSFRSIVRDTRWVNPFKDIGAST